MAQSSLGEAVANIPATAHILGGAVIGADYHTGVIDRDHRVFAYENLLVCDGAAIPANPGVNPSLTITALAELAMSRVPPKPGAPRVEPVHLAWQPHTVSQTAVVPDRPPAARAG